MKIIITILVGSIVWKLINEFNHDNLELILKMLIDFIQLSIMEIEVVFQSLQTLKMLRGDMYQTVNLVIAGSKKRIYILILLTPDPLQL